MSNANAWDAIREFWALVSRFEGLSLEARRDWGPGVDDMPGGAPRWRARIISSKRPEYRITRWADSPEGACEKVLALVRAEDACTAATVARHLRKDGV